MSVREKALAAKKSLPLLAVLSEKQRQESLNLLAQALEENIDHILIENQKDVTEATHLHLSNSIIDRLKLSEKLILSMAQMCRDVANQAQVVGMIDQEYKRPNGLIIQKQRIPLGVIGMVFESRPNVIIDGLSLAIKSSNALILKGGKEAFHSNRVLFQIAIDAVSTILPKSAFALVETREDIHELLKLNEFIDLMVPRGGSALINFVKAHATMPVVAHDKGLCHIYVHEDADESMVNPIVLNSKTQRPGVCNAAECLIIHEKYPNIKSLILHLLNEGVEIRGDEKSIGIEPRIKQASESDYATEYLDKIISLKIVSSIEEAIAHIQTFSSHHTEAIITSSKEAVEKFQLGLDASAIMVNASTRFNDGSELGLGAELGISTSKLHAYGPMGAKEMTTTRFLVTGQGQTR